MTHRVDSAELASHRLRSPAATAEGRRSLPTDDDGTAVADGGGRTAGGVGVDFRRRRVFFTRFDDETFGGAYGFV